MNEIIGDLRALAIRMVYTALGYRQAVTVAVSGNMRSPDFEVFVKITIYIVGHEYLFRQ